LVRYEIGNTRVYTGMPKLLVEKASKNPTTYTDTVPLDKVSMDIMGLLPTIES